MSPSDILLDRDRARRIGLPEAILARGKSLDQLTRILEGAAAEAASLLLTKLDPAQVAALPAELTVLLDFDPVSATGFFGPLPPLADKATVAIVSGGSSDAPVAREANRTLRFHGVCGAEIADVGVAGLWRLLERVEELRHYQVLIAVAGMEGALFTVLGGLLPQPIVAVPTSTGYGAARGGETALAAALSSCAPGIVAVNIDNGYGAACAALRLLKAAAKEPSA